MKTYPAYARTAIGAVVVPLNTIRLLFYATSLIILYWMVLGGGHDPLIWDTVSFRTSGYYFVIGIFAAIVANSTGAGGGIVFVPAFISLGMSAGESLATSIAIQCFGMTSGALSWISFHNRDKHGEPTRWQSFLPILSISILASWIGMLGAQRWLFSTFVDIHLLFSLFSLAVGTIILCRVLREHRQPPSRTEALRKREAFELFGICLAGGVITAWLSIGVGEILAVYLLFRRFEINLAIACAVCVTSATVLVGVQHYLFVTPQINFGVLGYAAPGALIGGAIAQRFALFLGVRRLKLMMSAWIILSALAYWAI